jgi:YcaO-like protein with predicted kinase domain
MIRSSANEGAATAKAHRRGTHRTKTPSQTFERVRRLFGPLGITRVANITGLDCIGIPVCSAYRPNARSLSVSQGKGVDLDAARASAVMEALELYHAEHVALPLRYMTWNEIQYSDPVFHLEALPRLSVSRFQANLSLLWISGIDLFGGTVGWLPFELVHANYEQPMPPGSGCFLATSNGLASGNEPSEAIVHGLCEVVERDAATLFRFRSLEEQHAMQVRIDSIDDPECVDLIARMERAGVAVGVWDITSDVGIATFLVVVQDRQPSPFRPVRPVEGMGCHPAREIALSRALTEAAQTRLTLIAGARDDSREHYIGDGFTEVAARAHERLQRRGERSFAEAPRHMHETFEEDCRGILAGLQRVGIEHAVVVDLTKPAFGIPVVRVVVPGLEPYSDAPGYLPGKRALPFLEARQREAAR